MKIKKKIPLIDQHDKQGFGEENLVVVYVPETFKKPIEDLTKNF